MEKRAWAQPAESLSDDELLRLILHWVVGPRKSANQPDIPEITSRLLRDLGGIGGLGQYLHSLNHPNCGSVSPATPNETAMPALSKAQLYRLAAVIELGRRACRSALKGRRLKSHADVQAWATGRLTDLEHEEVWVLAATSSSRVIGEWCVGRGGLHGCGLLPSDILRPILRAGVPALVLVHNHPSGDPTPSREDVVMTKTLHQACRTVGLILLDHVIVSRNGSQSLAECGLY